MANHYHQGRFIPKNPQKYVGDVNNIIYRSGWENKVMIWLDTNPSVIQWGSEECCLPYVGPGGTTHRYFPDFLIKVKNKSGDIVKYMIEVKPKAQTKPPVKPKKITKRYLESVETYAKNLAKWEAAVKYCDKYDMEFKILTEDHIFN